MDRRLICLALTALAACSGGGTSNEPTAPSCTSAVFNKGCFGTCDSCSLLTSALASSGVDVALNAGDNGGDPHSCDWEHLDTSGVPDVQVIVESNINAQAFEKICHPAEHGSNDGGITVAPVSGVGDDACDVQLQGLGGPALTFLVGCWAYTISIAGPSSQFPDATVEMEEARLAKLIVPML